MTVTSDQPAISSSDVPITDEDVRENQVSVNIISSEEPESSLLGTGPVEPAGNGVDIDCDDEDDDITVIGLDHNDESDIHHAATLAWIEQNGPEMEARRRNILMRELQRVQRASFVHFLLLCLVPTSLLLIVVATVIGDNESCSSEVTNCVREERTFINAFTTRCICDAISVDGEV
eukprot:CAMPEP_0195292176 /NCGR_PEP_ID=MMETSP0707-20130614/8657_1 /TAXON_ID=33640 /ORGANISM="Asterionellopsis glacialis, Strain CCMP134" /LENGTH=175 /DNA_ID=CAMNT_0040352575 /DNA_START=27 /DNA_END=554 /DNA_ORIENTATION=+